MRGKPVRHHRRAGFTLIELLLAGMITSFVLGSLTISMTQMAKARNASRERLEAFRRAEAALNTLRSDIVSVIRADDLFYTRLLILDDSIRGPAGTFDNDELLLFSNRVRQVRNIAFVGEGQEYETHYRIADDEIGPVLWQRRDAVIDPYDTAGGVATPLIDGVVGMNLEAYDGDTWFEDWDSDEYGLPRAVRITVVASGHHEGQDAYDAAMTALRTVVAIDRVAPPADLFEDEPLPGQETPTSGEIGSQANPGAADTGDTGQGGVPPSVAPDRPRGGAREGGPGGRGGGRGRGGVGSDAAGSQGSQEAPGGGPR